MQLFQRNMSNFKRFFVTVDETTDRYHTPEAKEQSKLWEISTKKCEDPSFGWEGYGYLLGCSKGIIFIDYLEKDKFITRE